MKYFKLTNETMVNAWGVTLFRIELTVDCKWGKAGDKGGWIESENLKNGDARVSGNAWVSGNAQVSGNARVYGDARVESNNDYSVFQGFGSSNRVTTVFKCEVGVTVNCGCFSGNLDQFIKQVIETHKDNRYAKMYLAIVEVIKIKFDL